MAKKQAKPPAANPFVKKYKAGGITSADAKKFGRNMARAKNQGGK